MNRLQSCVFGIMSGVIWTTFPIQNSVTPWALLLLAGAITGLVVTFTLLPFLKRSSDVIPVGLASFPLGAFVFGLTLSYVTVFADFITKNSFPSAKSVVVTPFLTGLGFAFFTSIVLPLAAIFYPAAILNVWALYKFRKNSINQMGL